LLQTFGSRAPPLAPLRSPRAGPGAAPGAGSAGAWLVLAPSVLRLRGFSLLSFALSWAHVLMFNVVMKTRARCMAMACRAASTYVLYATVTLLLSTPLPRA
jgi:hypothetical protein